MSWLGDKFEGATNFLGDVIYKTGIWDKISDSPTIQKMADAGEVEMKGGAGNFIKGMTQGTLAVGEGARETAVNGLGTLIAKGANAMGIDLTDRKAHPYFNIAADTGEKIDNDLRNGHPLDAIGHAFSGAGSELKHAFSSAAGGAWDFVWDFLKSHLLGVGLGLAGGLLGSQFGLLGTVAGFVGGIAAGHFLKDKFNISAQGESPATAPAPAAPAIRLMTPVPAAP